MSTPGSNEHVTLNGASELKKQLLASAVYIAFQTSLENVLRAASIPLNAVVVTTVERKPPNYAEVESFNIGPVLGGRVIEFRFQDKGSSTHLFKCQILSNTSALTTDALRAIVKGFEENLGKSAPLAAENPVGETIDTSPSTATEGASVDSAVSTEEAVETSFTNAMVVEEGQESAPTSVSVEAEISEEALPLVDEADLLQQAMAIIAGKIELAAPLQRKLDKFRRDRATLDLQITEIELEYAAALRENISDSERKALLIFLSVAKR